MISICSDISDFKTHTLLLTVDDPLPESTSFSKISTGHTTRPQLIHFLEPGHHPQRGTSGTTLNRSLDPPLGLMTTYKLLLPGTPFSSCFNRTASISCTKTVNLCNVCQFQCSWWISAQLATIKELNEWISVHLPKLGKVNNLKYEVIILAFNNCMAQTT